MGYPLKLEEGTSQIHVRASLLCKSTRYIPVYWKGAHSEYTLERHCDADLLGTLRSIGTCYLPIMLERPYTNLLGKFLPGCKGSPAEYMLENHCCTFNLDIGCIFKTLQV
jgi:hypothetical protein